MHAPRHYAGVLIAVEPGRLAEVAPAVASLEGASVHQHDAATCRCVVVLESADRAGQERLFRAVQTLPGVREASLVYHLVDADNLSRLVLEEPAP